MKVDVTILRPDTPYGFASIILGYSNPEKTEVELTVEYRNLLKFTSLTSGTAFDLFVMSCIVYGTDILLPRKKFGFDGWSREIDVTIPVGSPQIFMAAKEQLERTLNFLTGDVWTIGFTQAPSFCLYKRGEKQKVYKECFRKSCRVVNLFSGGIDSLIGAINQLQSSLDPVCLVSHTDSMFKGAKKDQEAILEVVKKKYSHFYYLPTRVDMGKYDLYGDKYEKETTLRSRSFLFLCMATLVAESIDSNMPVYVPENGTISLNYPLTPSRRSSCSTRTTHPQYFHLFKDFLRSIGLNHAIINKYQLCTKGEMVEQCKDQDLLKHTYKLSCSCGKRGTRKDIRDNSHAVNCGVCMPCIYRQAAMHKIGESELVGTDIFHSRKRRFWDIPDMPALVSYIRRNSSEAKIGRELLTNGSLPLDQLPEYAKLVMRTREEIKQWVRDKATAEIKRQFGL